MESFFEEETDGDLRSIIAYEPDGYEIVFLRDGVGDEYTPDEFDKSIADSRLDSLSRPLYESGFSEEHGDLTCLVQAFDEVVEMNFILADGHGVAVGLDADALKKTHGIVAEAREILLEERAEFPRSN